MLLKDKKGQALIEYVLIVALISIIAIALVNYFGGYLKDAMTKSSCSIVGEEYVKGEKPGEGYCVDPEAEELLDETEKDKK